MFSRGALAVLAVVVAEYLLFGFAAGLVGTSTVVWVSVAAAVVGVLLVRRHLRALAQRRPDRGLLVVAGLLLIVPGLLSGAAGLSLLVPPVRRRARAWLWSRVEAHVERLSGLPGGWSVLFTDGGRPHSRRAGDVVDVEWSEGTARGRPANEDHIQSAPPELP
jgi:UPF0716 protein FxsA